MYSSTDMVRNDYVWTKSPGPVSGFARMSDMKWSNKHKENKQGEFSMPPWSCVRQTPGSSPVSPRVLVRPGISAYSSELCSSFPLSSSPRQRRTTPTWITANSEPSSQHGGTQDDSQQGQLCECHMQPSLSDGRQCAAGSKLIYLLNVWIEDNDTSSVIQWFFSQYEPWHPASSRIYQ